MPKDEREAARLLGAAALAENVDAEVEYGIALFNGTGVAKNEATAAKYLTRAAFKGSAIAQNRLARMYMTGRGLAADPIAAIKWHTVAKANGVGDTQLDEFANKQPAETRAAGENAAKPWLQVIINSRS